MSSVPLSRSIERHLIPWTALDWPHDWGRRFGRHAPLGLEIGFGNGAFMEELAAARPETNWVAGEISWASVRRLLRRLDRRGLANVAVFQGNGAFVLEHAFAPDSLDEIHLNHPDPWPKPRHHGRRLIQPGFVDQARRVLKPGGQFLIVTDHRGYFRHIRRVLLDAPLFARIPLPKFTGEGDERVGTNFERKYIAQGRAFHSAALMRYA